MEGSDSSISSSSPVTLRAPPAPIIRTDRDRTVRAADAVVVGSMGFVGGKGCGESSSAVASYVEAARGGCPSPADPPQTHRRGGAAAGRGRRRP